MKKSRKIIYGRKVFYGLNGTVFPEGETCPGISVRAPLVAIDNGTSFGEVNSQGGLLDKGYEEWLRESVEEVYRAWGKFGPYGDVISITTWQRFVDVLSVDFRVHYIGRLEYPKPSLAADLLPFILDKNGHLFFVGIVRGKEPGLGKAGLIGGHRDVNGYDFESAAKALLHESADEAGFSITPFGGGCQAVESPTADQVAVKVALGGQTTQAMMERLGTYRTGWEERLEYTCTKRVDETTAFMTTLYFFDDLNEEKVKSWFQAGDDAQEIVVVDALATVPEFGISHHAQIYFDALRRLSQKGRLGHLFDPKLLMDAYRRSIEAAEEPKPA